MERQQHSICSADPRIASTPAMVDLLCDECGKLFSVERWVANRGRKFCSKTCGNRTKARAIAELAKRSTPIAKCLNCDNEFSLAGRSRNNPNIYCSNACRYAHKRGVNAANFGGGENIRGPLNKRWNGGNNRSADWKACSPGIRRWRGAIFRRDGRTCKRCGANGKNVLINAHHIVPWNKCLYGRFDINNGITLCKPCHIWVHGKGNTNSDYLFNTSAYGDAVLPQIAEAIARAILAVSPSPAGGGGSVARTLIPGEFPSETPRSAP